MLTVDSPVQMGSQVSFVVHAYFVEGSVNGGIANHRVSFDELFRRRMKSFSLAVFELTKVANYFGRHGPL